MRANEFGQPIGPDLGGWTPPGSAPQHTMAGAWVTVRPWVQADATPLHHAFSRSDASIWTYMPWGPFADDAELATAIDGFARVGGAVPFTLLVGGEPEGLAAYLRIALREGTIEIGGLTYSDALQRTAAATEAMSLMIGAAFDAGFRRVEWKCDDLNEASRRAAQRLGFRYEGTFRQATHYKGRSRDTAWFAITDQDWPAIRRAHEAWLAPSNFDADGIQRSPLRTSNT